MRTAALLTLFLLFAGCASPPKPTYRERVVLLPDADGRSSAVIVRRDGTERQLNKSYEVVDYENGKEVVSTAQPADVQQRYSALLGAAPQRPVAFVLFYNLNTIELTPQSRATLNEVKQRLSTFPAAEITVVGHTDTSGTVENNDALSLSRARSVRDQLVQLGIPTSSIEIVGRGSRELAVKTAAAVREDRNRRVEIKVR